MSTRVRNLLALMFLLACGLGLSWMRGRAREAKALELSDFSEEQENPAEPVRLVEPKAEGLTSAREMGRFQEGLAPTRTSGPGMLLQPEQMGTGTGTLRGEVRSDFGVLVPNCVVVLAGNEPDRRVMSDSQGRFAFPNTKFGAWKVSVETTGSPRLLENPMRRNCADEIRPWLGAQCVSFAGGADSLVTCIVRSAARVTGRVIDQKGAPVAKATVYYDHDDAAYWMNSSYVQTGEHGEFFIDLHPGIIHLRTSLSQYSDWTYLGVPPEVELTLVAAEERDLGDIVLGGGSASLVGRVTDANGDPAATIKVVMTRSGGVGSMSVESDVEGKFAFLGVYPGQYQLAVAPDGAILGNPRRFLHVPGPVQEVVVTGEAGTVQLGDFELRFDGSFHFYAELVFADGHLPAWEDMRARVFLPSGIELKDQDLEFQSRTKFEWHVREPDLFSDVLIEVSELDAETKEPLWTKTVECQPKRHQRQRVRIPVE